MRCEPRFVDAAERRELSGAMVATCWGVGCAGMEAAGGVGTWAVAEVVAGVGEEEEAGGEEEGGGGGEISVTSGALLLFTGPPLPPLGVPSVD